MNNNNNTNIDLLRPLVPNDKHYAMTQQMAAAQQQAQAAAATIATRSSSSGGGLRYCQLPSSSSATAQVSSGSSSGSLSGSGASVSTSSGGSSSSSSNNSSPVPAPQPALAIGGKQLANIPNVAPQSQPSSSSSRYNLRPSQGPSIVSRIDAELQLQPSLAFTNLTPAATLALTANNTQASPLLTLSTTTNTNGTHGTTSTSLGDRQSIVQALLPGGSVPEFLYQLTKMLTTPTHKSIIEWSTITGQGRIEVHAPSKLESQILGKYFRHTKYSSFQRQLNYFGFRKIAGKGKMSPCSYINDNATCDIRSLLLMKRKNAGSNGSGGTRGGDRTLKEGGKSSKGSGKKSPTRRSSGKNSTTTGGAKRGRKRKVSTNPGNDIQPATVQPMFNTSITSSTTSSFGGSSSGGMSSSLPMTQSTQNFNDMAASIAQNIASSSSGQQPSVQQQPSSQQQHQVTTASSANGQQGYTVAIGKGVKHQLNGYLRFSNKGIAHSVVVRDPSTTIATGSSPTSGSSSTTGAASISSGSNATTASSSTVSSNTVAASNNNITATTSQQPSYATHPSTSTNQGAILSAPAPLQFLDPSELGMSIENSLSQLKDNFAAASASASALSNGVGNGGAAVSTTAGSAAAASMTTEASTAVSSSTSSSNAATTSSTSKFNNLEPTKLQSSTSLGSSGLTRRVTSTTYLGGMLSRDDSLINLAMLPTLDNNNSNNALLTSNGSGGSNSNDSLVNLAASVETPLVAGQHNMTTTDSSSAVAGEAEVSTNKSGGGEVWF